MHLCITLNLMVLLVFAEGFLLQNGTAPGTVFQQNGCPFGWTKYSLHCYYYSVSRKTWTTAENTCEQFGGHLVIIEDNDEDSFIQSFLNVSKTYANDWLSSYTWAGASDLAEEGTWLWVTGKPVGVFTNWRGQGPNNGHHGSHTEDCMDLSGGGWNDNDCASYFSFVCEIKAKVD